LAAVDQDDQKSVAKTRRAGAAVRIGMVSVGEGMSRIASKSPEVDGLPSQSGGTRRWSQTFVGSFWNACFTVFSGCPRLLVGSPSLSAIMFLGSTIVGRSLTAPHKQAAF
jgi:hypothetical protein